MSMPGKRNAGPGEVAALLLIDVQLGLKEVSWGKRNNPDAEQTIARLLAGWRAPREPRRRILPGRQR